MFELIANGHNLSTLKRELLVCGNVNTYEVKFTLSEDWQALDSISAVFNTDGGVYPVIMDGTTVKIPWEVLTEPNQTVFVGLYGYTGEQLVMVSNLVVLGDVVPGGKLIFPQEEMSRTPSPYEQLDIKFTNEIKEIREILESGGTVDLEPVYERLQTLESFRDDYINKSNLRKWKVLGSVTVENQNILSYGFSAQDCNEFIVTWAYADDKNVSGSTNASLGLNAPSGSSYWSTNRISGNMSNPPSYSEKQPYAMVYQYGFSQINGEIIHNFSRQSGNYHASADTLSAQSAVVLNWTRAHGTTPWNIKVDKINDLGVGSWRAGWCGIGSRLEILGRQLSE